MCEKTTINSSNNEQTQENFYGKWYFSIKYFPWVKFHNENIYTKQKKKIQENEKRKKQY